MKRSNVSPAAQTHRAGACTVAGFVAGAAALVALTLAADGQATTYPACTTNCFDPTPTGPIMNNQVNLYVIQLGNQWQTNKTAKTTTTALDSLLTDLNQSNFWAIAANYYDNGSAAQFYSSSYFGVSASGPISIKSESDTQHVVTTVVNALHLTPDPNGVYMVIDSPDVSDSTDCAAKGCAHHGHFLFNGTDVKYTYDAALSCPNNCQSGIQVDSVNGSQIDQVLITQVHELFETITDPAGTGYSSSKGEMGDVCQPQYNLAVGGGPATQLFSPQVGIKTQGCNPWLPIQCGYYTTELNGHFYVLPSLRANQSPVAGGTPGYCTSSYGGVFWAQNWGYNWSPVGDWSYGNFKGECAPNAPLVGLSAVPFAQAHAVLCDTNSGSLASQRFAYTGSSCYPRYFGDAIGDNYGFPADGGWDPQAAYAANCAPKEIVTGVSQTEPGDWAGPGRTNGLLCCPAAVAPPALTTTEYFYGQDSVDTTNVADWDVGYNKGECPAGWYISGVSTDVSGYPRTLRCIQSW